MASRMPGLEGLRALAVIAVVWHHTHPGINGLPQTTKGFLGVDAFFVLSGFLIATLLIEERGRNGRISLWRFYMRRALRIFPLYYSVLAALTVYSLLAAPGSSNLKAQFLSELPSHATFTSNWIDMEGAHSLMAISWSLSAEEQFYLLWPPVFVWLGRHVLWLLAVLVGLNQAINFGLLDGWLTAIGLPYSHYWILQVTFTPILLGILLAFALQNAVARSFLERATRQRALFLFLVFSVAFAAISADDVRGLPRLAVHLAIAAFLADIVLRPTTGPSRWLEWRPLAFVGTVSYGVYLLHMIVLHFVRRALTGAELEAPSLLFVGCLAATVGLATISYRYLERPFLLLKRRVQS